jgi:peptidoglycan hydrolase FlgJ
MPDAITLPGAPLPLSTTQQPRREDSAMAEVRRAAEEFEAVFLAQMLAPMFEGLQTDGLGGGGMGEEIFRPMLIERYAEALSRTGGVGLADSIVRELMRMQAAAATTETANGADR